MATDRWWNKPVSIAPLVTFRIVFGALMCFSLLRFWWRGWIKAVYIDPPFHFSYWGFDWVQSLGDPGMYWLFGLVIVAGLCICIGFCYRLASVVFCLGFTYIELIDVTTYLNHYYFISLVALLLVFLPANRMLSVDAMLWPRIRQTEVAQVNIGILRFQLAVVYIFAGLAKLNYDWLIRAEPMRTWLPAKSHLPIVGPLMYETWVAYLFSWFGAAYDLFIVFFLLQKKYRPVAYLFVMGFHIATALFFPAIGMFPYIMMACSLVFLSGDWHKKVLTAIFGANSFSSTFTGNTKPLPAFWRFLVFTYVLLQLIVPLRFLLYRDRLFWTEEGYRFSWRVMLMEKAGNAQFTVRDGSNSYEVNNAQYLTPLQEKMMSTQPDLILKYAHHLAAVYRQKGLAAPEVYADVRVTLNGSPSKPFINSNTNLAAQPLSWKHYPWILQYDQ